MPRKDPRVDAYIKKAPPFAQPILAHLRKVVHRAVPGVEETMKWSSPHFDYKGMFCGISAFKEHVGFGFWKAALLAEHLPGRGGVSAAGQFGRIESMQDLPSDKELTRILKIAKKLNDDEVKAPSMRKGPRPELKAPADLLAALAKNKKARATFDEFSSRTAPRIRRLGRRSQAGRDAGEADRDRGQVDGRRQDSQLEVREVRKE